MKFLVFFDEECYIYMEYGFVCDISEQNFLFFTEKRKENISYQSKFSVTWSSLGVQGLHFKRPYLTLNVLVLLHI